MGGGGFLALIYIYKDPFCIRFNIIYVCILGADICQNYTDIVRNITECSVAVSGFKDKETHIELLCRGYDVYISCLEVTIHKMGKGCEERSLRTWIPQYMEKSFNLSASTVMTCNGKVSILYFLYYCSYKKSLKISKG